MGSKRLSQKHLSDWTGVWLATGAAAVIGLLTYTGPYRWVVALMAFGGAACFTKTAFDIGWMRAPHPVRAPIRAGLVILTIWVGMGLFAYKVWPKSSDGFMQLGEVWFHPARVEAGKPLVVNLWMKNGGQAPVYGVYPYFSVSLSSSSAAPSDIHAMSLSAARAHQVEQINSGDGGKYVGKGQGLWYTLATPSLTSDQVDAFMTGQLRLYVFEWARWRGGAQDLDECLWLQPPPTADISDPQRLVWHLCDAS